MSPEQIKALCVGCGHSLREVMAVIDRNARGIALVVGDGDVLVATITDGDIRRAILNGSSLDATVEGVLAQKAASPYPTPITAAVGLDTSALMQLMRERGVHHLPLIDEAGRLAGLVTYDDLVPREVLPLHAVVMAGGFGSRLRPLTEDTPKPMLKVGDRPLLELIIGQLRAAGIQQVNITTHYKPEKITDHFGDGQRFGVNLNYVSEKQPLGTAGAIGLMKEPDQPLLVINGDILTKVDYRAMLAYHREHKADLTIGVRQYDLQVPYGVLESNGSLVKRIREKPTYSFFVNAGIYLLQPDVHGFIPQERRCDMPELIEMLIAAGRRVVSFPIVEYWLDIGKHADYLQAQEDHKDGRFSS